MNSKGIIIGALLIGTILVVLYVILRQSKNSPITNTPTPIKTTITQTKGFDFQGIGAGLGAVFGTGGVGSLFSKREGGEDG